MNRYTSHPFDPLKTQNDRYTPPFINSKIKKEGIFMLGPSFPFRGGISHYNTLLFNHLSKKYKVMFYSFKKQYFNLLFPGKSDRDISVEKIEPENHREGKRNDSQIKRILHPLNLRSWIRAGREARRYRLILIPWWVVFWVPYYFLFLNEAKKDSGGNKVIFLCHNVTEHEGDRLSLIKRSLSRMILQKGDAFILHSQGQEQQLFNLLKKIKPVLISPHPLYWVFNKNRYTSFSARKELGIHSRKKVILFFGFIREYKGLKYLIKAIPMIKSCLPDTLLLIAGEVWNGKRHYISYTRLIKQLAVAENICFINRYIPNEEVEKYFKACDIVVLPYLEGGGSGILQIAYGMNRPVVATDICAFRDVVEEGKTGFLVPPADEVELAKVIINMFSNGLMLRMEEDIQKYQKKFDWMGLEDKINSLYNL